MKVVLINKTDSIGGAAVACRRLLDALNHAKVDAQLLVSEKHLLTYKNIEETATPAWKKKFNFLVERLSFLSWERSKEVRFSFSLANTGEKIASHKLVQEADIIHLHWFNQGYLSMKSIEDLLKLGKPIVWTLHDMWAFTGGCHYSEKCYAYTKECGYCPFLSKPSAIDLSNRIWQLKNNIYNDGKIQFVTCSKWLGEVARTSSLLAEQNVRSIPNPIDVELFKPMDRDILIQKYGLSGDKVYILFGAANVFDDRKGLIYFIEAMELVKRNNPSLHGKIELLLFGRCDQTLINQLPFKVHEMSYQKTEQSMAELYNLAFMFVIPSLQDNLPNTVMESLACGTPVVGFDVGGIPEMLEHKVSGYLAQYKSSEDLAEGIQWIIKEKFRQRLSENAQKKILDNYTYEKIGNQYLALYERLLK